VLVASRLKLIEMKCRVKPIRDKDLSDITALQLIEQNNRSVDSEVESILPLT
jgi:hypothetical protein